MILTWYGHSFFLMESESGTRIATDPHDPPTGYPTPALRADAVTVSHSHHDHAYVQCVSGAAVVDHREGTKTIGDISVTAFATYHDDVRGKKRGENTMYVFDIDGLRIAHLGDLGVMLTDGEIARMGVLDVLMLPVGGVYTIDAAQAADLAQRFNAPCVIPMHYKTQHLSFDLSGVEPFLERRGGSIVHSGQTIELDKKFISNCTLVMNYL